MNSLKSVLLIDPPAREPSQLNTGLAWLAANILDVTKTVKVLGLANIVCTLERGEQLVRKHVEIMNPDIVGFNIHCTTYQTALQMIRSLRNYFKGIIVIGGPHTVYANLSIMDDSPETDLVVLGEAEYSMAQICQRPTGQYFDIPGVIFRHNSQIIHNPINPRRFDFKGLKHPDFRQFGIKKIHLPYPISTSRGCPFHCCFCNPFMGGKWRPRPLEEVFDELEFAINTFEIKSFRLVEPVFNLRAERVIEFCSDLRKRKINLPWESGSGLRADFITKEVVEAMKTAGCTHIKIGIESLVPEIFKHINKGESIDDIKRAIQIIKKASMPVWGSFIIGLPHDTYQTAMENYRLSKELGIDFSEWSLLFPYPGTAAYEWMEKHGTIYHTIETAHQSALDSANQELVNVACDTPEFPKEERIKAYFEINWKSGNYIYSASAKDWKKAFSIMQGIFQYDPFRLIFHMMRLIKLLKRRKRRMSQQGEYYEYNENAY